MSQKHRAGTALLPLPPQCNLFGHTFCSRHSSETLTNKKPRRNCAPPHTTSATYSGHLSAIAAAVKRWRGGGKS